LRSSNAGCKKRIEPIDNGLAKTCEDADVVTHQANGFPDPRILRVLGEPCVDDTEIVSDNMTLLYIELQRLERLVFSFSKGSKPSRHNAPARLYVGSR
jgi:hypothetical protein